jgi:hypothetical protein
MSGLEPRDMVDDVQTKIGSYEKDYILVYFLHWRLLCALCTLLQLSKS